MNPFVLEFIVIFQELVFEISNYNVGSLYLVIEERVTGKFYFSSIIQSFYHLLIHSLN